MFRRRKDLNVFDPRSPRPRLGDPQQLADPFAPRSVRQHDDRRPLPPRLVAFGILSALAFGALALNLYNLQVKQSTHFNALAEGNRVRKVISVAPRGIIFDRHGTQMVTNTANFAVAVVPVDLPRGAERTEVLTRLNRAIGISPAEVERQVKLGSKEPFQPIILKNNLDSTTYQVLSENIPTMPGVLLQTDTSRHYLSGAGMSHILGYVGKLDAEDYKSLSAKGYLFNDTIGRAGLEYVNEKFLRGKPGLSVVETDAHGHVVHQISNTDPVPGNNVYMTIDLNLQKEVAKDLQEAMDVQHKKFGGNKALAGAALVMNPQTGELLSLVSLPDYDINLFAGGISTSSYQALLQDPGKPLLDRAINGVYPPGSTFKPVTASAALQAGTVNRNSTIFCPGHFTRGGSTFGCWNLAGHGSQDVVQAIAHSCDVFFYTVADQMGDVLLNRFAKDFGVGRRTGIDLPGEAKGIAPDRDWKKVYFAQALQETGDQAWADDRWYEGNTITYGIGQSYLLSTPLQDLEWTATVANGGNYMRPQVTGPILGVDGSAVKPFKPIVDHRVSVTPEVLAVVKEGLRAAVSGPGGTAYLLKPFPEAAGKTGSAQYGTPDAKGNYAIHGWFTAFAPATDPEVAIVVFVEGGGEGHEASEPVAAKIMAYYLAHRDEIRKTVSQG